MKRTLLAAAAAVTIGLAGTPVAAQVVVHDPAALAQMLKEAKTALDQLRQMEAQLTEAQKLYESLNQVSNVNELASVLNTPGLRQYLPADAAGFSGGLEGLGEVGQRAIAIRNANQLYTAPQGGEPTEAEAFYQAALERSGQRAARDMAIGERTYEVSSVRLSGLEALQRSLDTAPNARAVMDIQARIAAEQAMIQNDATRLQGLAMLQDGEQRMELQRDRERVKAQREATKSMYREGFE